jgi:peptidoglycan/xylan/chitin deacetylase (PgdA/CDA1 family)
MSFEWPGGRLGAISLTFDDGMRSQLEVAAPLLERHGLCGTFYVNPRDNYREQLAPWGAVAAAGHEIGNHTVSHPCSKGFSFISQQGRRGLEELSWEEMAAEIATAKQRLDEMFPTQGRVSFAYPCYQPFVGRGENRRSYVPLVVEQCIAGRGRGERANDPHYCDLGYLWSWPCERMTGAEMVGLVEQTIADGRWGILTFHGVHEGHLSVGEGELGELCAHLQRNAERVWTAPVAEVAAWVAPRQAW